MLFLDRHISGIVETPADADFIASEPMPRR